MGFSPLQALKCWYPRRQVGSVKGWQQPCSNRLRADGFLSQKTAKAAASGQQKSLCSVTVTCRRDRESKRTEDAEGKLLEMEEEGIGTLGAPVWEGRAPSGSGDAAWARASSVKQKVEEQNLP